MMNSNGELEIIKEEMYNDFEHYPVEKARAFIKKAKRNKAKLKIAKKSRKQNRNK